MAPKQKTHKKKPEKKPVGRPTDYTPALAKAICKALLKYRNLKKACEKEKGLPSRDTIHEWRFDGEHKEFSDMYVKARMCVVEDYVDQVFEISEEVHKVREIVRVQTIGKGEDAETTITELEKVDPGAVNQMRLRIDTIKWVATKVIPKVYGDTLKLGADGELLDAVEEIKAARKRAGLN